MIFPFSFQQDCHVLASHFHEVWFESFLRHDTMVDYGVVYIFFFQYFIFLNLSSFQNLYSFLNISKKLVIDKAKLSTGQD